MTEVLAGLPTGTAVPEPGQLVRVRSRRWVATNVERSTQGGEPDELSRGPEHLVTLVSVDDDAFGKELRVIWELELGSAVLDRSVLPSPDPERFDDPRRLGAFLDAVRWGAITSADSRALQAPFRSGIEIEDYQLDPVVRALSMPRVNLLVADDVGRFAVDLDEQSYDLAIRAHREGATITVEGRLVREGRQLILADPRGFSILDLPRR
jgi:hypothetical protein